MLNAPKPSLADHLTGSQRNLQAKLIEAIHEAIPTEVDLEEAVQRAHGCYRKIAQALVDLRHEFPGPNGEPPDLQGRSSPYRIAVRDAYGAVSSDRNGPLPKRLTAGVAYWVRKTLIERYGEKALYENGTIRRIAVKVDRCSGPNDRMIGVLPNDPADRLDILISMLNSLAVDPRLAPSEEAVRSAFRAVLLLRNKLNGVLKNDRQSLRSPGVCDGAADAQANRSCELMPEAVMS
ncbi:MAG: hypothetical protein ACRD0K_18250 [Egibacteraceae bacterium]